jgi:hypothetical protein
MRAIGFFKPPHPSYSIQMAKKEPESLKPPKLVAFGLKRSLASQPASHQPPVNAWLGTDN